MPKIRDKNKENEAAAFPSTIKGFKLWDSFLAEKGGDLCATPAVLQPLNYRLFLPPTNLSMVRKIDKIQMQP